MVESPLYRTKNINNGTFSRNTFEKTGSGLTLVGGSLKEKTIIRHITANAFLARKTAYEAYPTRKKEGFDYVPIEPIQSYNINKDGLVDVYSSVLDLNFQEWINKTNMFENELEKTKLKIKEVLYKLNIKHSHDHNGNFCLRFFRDKQGDIDFKRIPRIYLIDFDQAISPAKE